MDVVGVMTAGVRFPWLAEPRRSVRVLVEPAIRFVATILGDPLGGRGTLGAYNVVVFPLPGSDQRQIWSRLSGGDRWKRATGVRCAVTQSIPGRFVIEPHTGGQLVIESSVIAKRGETSVLALPDSGIALVGLAG